MLNKLNEAVQLVEMGHVEEGLTLIREMRKNSDHETLYEIAEQYMNWGLLQDAENVIQELAAYYPDDGDLQILMAELYIEMDREEEALSVLAQISPDDPSYLSALLLQADLYQSQGLYEVAERKLQEAKKRAPEEPVLSYALGEFYLDRGDFIKSAAFFQEAEKYPSDIPKEDLYLRLAESLSRSGQFEASLDYYKKGLKKKKELHSLFGYGLTAYKVGEFKQAIHAFNELKNLDPDYTTLYPILSSAYEEEGALVEAMEVLKEGMKKDEYNEEMFLQAAKLAYKLNNNEEGEAYLRQIMALNPSNLEAAFHFASILKKEERFDELVELMNEMLKLGEEAPEIHWYLATGYRELEQYNEAMKAYDTAFLHYVSDEEFLEEYGFFLLEEGLTDKAKTVLKKALTINPEAYHLEEIIERMSEF
ncbi:tetratricopeptide repeat protein [Fictibacillus sp. Mic-4]|uniref:tetratricopeptide repeat protein n=1 Tax=Fictibacillus sp. Mic-4 TaxID=3132826 RepID=UPI003CF0F48B